MKAPNKMMIAVGALALTATTLLAGCGGSSDNAAEPAAAESAAVEAPGSSGEGLVQPASVSDETWAAYMEGTVAADQLLSNGSPEQLAATCEFGNADSIDVNAEKWAASGEGTLEEWTAVLTAFSDNYQLMACSMVE